MRAETKYRYMETATEKAINDKIDAWHNSPEVGLALYEFLGWSLDEYRIWVETGVWPEREYIPLKPHEVWSIIAIEKYGTIRWFGKVLSAPAFDGRCRIDPPVNIECRCGKKFIVGDQGVALPFYANGGLTALAYHLHCFRALL